MEAADAHLAQDPVLRHLIEDFGGPLPLEHDSRGRPPELYGALLRSITGQQLSVKAALAVVPVVVALAAVALTLVRRARAPAVA